MMKGIQTERDIEQAILMCLHEIPFAEVVSVEREKPLAETSCDFQATLRLPEGEQTLIVEVKSSGQPRLAREAINQLLRCHQRNPVVYPVFAAPYVSPRAAAMCWQEGVGYLDLAGNCRLSFRNVYIRQEGNPNPFSEKRELRSLYSPRATRVLRVLLADPSRTWKIQDLAEEAGVSLGQAHNVKKLLSDREWIRSEHGGFGLSEPDQLLAQWAQNYTYRRNKVHDFYSLKGASEIEYALAEACREYGFRCALTGFSAAARLAPHVRYQRASAYLADSGLEKLATELGLKRVTSGANVSLLAPYDEGVFYDQRDYDGVPVVSPIQAYLDLQGQAGRGEEAADFLLEEVIRPKWQIHRPTTPPRQ